MVFRDDSVTRRRILGLSASVFGGAFLAGCSSSGSNSDEGGTPMAMQNETVHPRQLSLQKLGQTHLSVQSPAGGGYSEVAVRADGRYAIVGTKWGTNGTYLVDLTDPLVPERVHHLPSSNGAPNMDVKVDHRNGLYYRTIEYADGPGNFEVVDYGFQDGTPKNPRIIGQIDEGKSHNLTPHPAAPVLYTVNYYEDEATAGGFDVYDVSDPTTPRKLGTYGPQGACHDITVDPARELLSSFYQGGEFIGFVMFDVSEPRNPIEVGRFDYTDRTSYSEVEVGEEAFRSAHHGHFDPRRELLIVGDERPFGIPGGKHVFDIGWRDGSLADPVSIGFTVSPNARPMESDDRTERFDWTGHHFNIVPLENATLLVSADWHEGIVLYDITDPTDPHSIDRYPTADGMDRVTPNEVVTQLGAPPMAWKAAYNAPRDLIVASDTFTGLYTFELAS